MTALCHRIEEILGEGGTDLSEPESSQGVAAAAATLLTRARVLAMEVWSLRRVFDQQREQVLGLEPERVRVEGERGELRQMLEVQTLPNVSSF